jgi:hypothetical protein
MTTPDAQVRSALVRDLGLQGAIRYAEKIANAGGEFAEQYRRIGEELRGARAKIRADIRAKYYARGGTF